MDKSEGQSVKNEIFSEVDNLRTVQLDKITSGGHN